jgi:hypothetical protein
MILSVLLYKAVALTISFLFSLSNYENEMYGAFCLLILCSGDLVWMGIENGIFGFLFFLDSRNLHHPGVQPRDQLLK